MRVENVEARDFYEREAVAGGWDRRTLERQIHSYYHERILKSRQPEKMLADGRRLPVPITPAIDELKKPDGYVRMYDDLFSVSGPSETT